MTISILSILGWLWLIILNGRLSKKAWLDDDSAWRLLILSFLAWPLVTVYLLWVYSDKIFKSKTPPHDGIYQWWDMVEYQGQEAMYCGISSIWSLYIILKWSHKTTYVSDVSELKPLIRSSYMQEELEIFAQAEQLRKQSENLMKKVKNKRTIFNP